MNHPLQFDVWNLYGHILQTHPLVLEVLKSVRSHLPDIWSTPCTKLKWRHLGILVISEGLKSYRILNSLICLYCGVFTPCKNYNIETLPRLCNSRRSSVVSVPCRAELNLAEASWTEPLSPDNSYKHLDNARVGKGHVTALATTQQLKAFSHMSDPRVYRSSQ
jgi:hypothetical protein